MTSTATSSSSASPLWLDWNACAVPANDVAMSEVSTLRAVDCTSALAYFDLAAPTYGLGACWAGFVMVGLMQWQPLRDALAIPADNVVHGVLMAGYPKYRYQRLVPRNAPKIEWRM